MGKWIKGIHHAGLKPAKEQYDKVMAFYTGLLKMDLVHSWVKEGNRGAMIDTGDGLLEIIETADGLPSGPDAFEHLAFHADGAEAVDELAELIRSAGYPILAEPKDITLPTEPPYPIRVCFCRGAAGEKIEFFSER